MLDMAETPCASVNTLPERCFVAMPKGDGYAIAAHRTHVHLLRRA